MYITQTYKYEYNGIVYVSGNVPEGATILETMDILYAEEGYLLEHKITKLLYGSVSLEEGRKQSDYIEIDEPNE